MSISGIGGGFDIQSLFGTQKTEAKQTDPFAEILSDKDKTEELNKTAEEEFLDYARMSVAERIRAQYLEEQGLTEEQVAEMEVEKRKAIEEEIRQKIEEAITGETGKTAGSIANILV